MSGLRERKKQATRIAIRDAAMALFEQHGFAHTTFDRIAEAADVSRATVFSYFPTKEEIVFGDAAAAVDALAAMLAERPAGQSTIATVRAWLGGLTGWIEPELVLQLRLAREVPSIGARRLQLHGEIQNAMADAFEAELGPGRASRGSARGRLADRRVRHRRGDRRRAHGGGRAPSRRRGGRRAARRRGGVRRGRHGRGRDALLEQLGDALRRAGRAAGRDRAVVDRLGERGRDGGGDALGRGVLDLERARVAVAREPVGDVDALLEVVLERERDERRPPAISSMPVVRPPWTSATSHVASTRSRSGT